MRSRPKRKNYANKMNDNTLIFDFLKDLVANNNREWFKANKERYNTAWEMFNQMVDELIQAIVKFDDSVQYLTAKDCIYRIYRDLRFTQDKTPYKGHFGAYINAAGKKSFYGGYYLQLEPHQVVLASGVWWLPPKEMRALRYAIVDQIDIFEKIVDEPEFKKHCPVIGFGTERYKRIPNGFPKDFRRPEFLLCKDFTCSCTLKPSDLNKKDYIQHLAELFHCMKPFNDFLKENVLINLEEMESMKNVVKFF